MRKLFIHTPVFRFLSPVFSGIVAYLLILLIKNDIAQLQEEFLSQELYVCIALSYMVHEFSLLLLWLIKRIPSFFGTAIMLLIHICIAFVLCVAIVTLIFFSYYKYAYDYAPLIEELYVFNSIYCTIPISYVLLNLSHQYLYKINTQKLEQELLIKQNIEEEFKQFKKEINPDLLFESFEVLLGFIKENKDKVDEFIDHLATIYRYILASRKEQLVSIKEEQEILDELILLYNHLPYRKVSLTNIMASDFLIVPGTLLYIVEQIIKTTIVSTRVDMQITIELKDDCFTISYVTEDRILDVFDERSIEEIVSVYSIYSEKKLDIFLKENTRTITVPILKIKA